MAIDAQDAGQRVPQHGQQRVEHQRDDRRVLPDPAQQRDGDQKPEEREAWDGLHHVGEPEHPPL